MSKPSSTFDFSDAPTQSHQSAAWSFRRFARQHFRLLAGARRGDLTSVQISSINETSAALSSVETGVGDAGASVCPITRFFQGERI